jgi:hypothetical protein
MYDKKTHRTNEVFKLLKVIKTKGLLFSEVCGTIKLKKNSSLLCCFFFQFF